MRGTMMILMICIRMSFLVCGRAFGTLKVIRDRYRITLNTCITNLRKKKNYDYVPLKQDIDILDDCEHDECMKHLYQLIHQLDNVDKMYIMLWLDEKSYDEIAEIVGVGRNNVAIRIHRIKEKLKKMSNR